MKLIEGFFSLSFLFFFIYHIFIVKVQEITWCTRHGENKTQNAKQTKKVNTHQHSSSGGVRTSPWPTYGRENQSKYVKETLLEPAKTTGNLKNYPI